MLAQEAATDIRKKKQAIKEHVLTEARIAMGDVEVLLGKQSGYDLRTRQVPIDYYHNHHLIDDAEYRAGNKIYRDFYISGQTMNLTVNLNAVRSGDCRAYLPSTELQREARDNYRKAIDAVNGRIGQLMVRNICCFGYKIRDAYDKEEDEMQEKPCMNYLPYRTPQEAMARFREALGDLIEFYGLTRNS